jgi:DNA-binding winged helix-turn-helix (wHTH) protein/Tol biopolymer transport system component
MFRPAGEAAPDVLNSSANVTTGRPEMEKTAEPGGRGNSPAVVRFGAFELDLRAGELRKEGRRIRLQEQPFQILRMLLESPGEVVSREELRKRLWPDDTVVEFDHSINAAVKRLRDALRDSPEKPRYIATVARRGYRFIAEVGAADRPKLAEPVAVALENDFTNRQPEPASLRARLYTRPRPLVSLMVGAIVLMAWAGAWYYRRGARPFVAPLQPLMRLDLDLGNDVPPVPEVRATAVILSPDGTRLAYVSQSQLFTRRLDQAEATELAKTEGLQDPFFSPDGQWVGFFARGILNKVSIHERQVIRLGDGTLFDGGSWGEDGNIIAGFDNRLARISSAGGTPTPVTELAPGEIAHRWPQILPGGKAVVFSAYTSMTGLDGAAIEAQSLRDGHRKTLVRGGTWGRYLASGHLVYVNKGTLFAVPFDPERLEVHGTPTPVLEEVAYDSAFGSALIDFSRTGMLVYQSSKGAGGLVTVQWLDQSGNTRPLLPVPGNYLSPTLSPDASRLALTSAGDIWVYELGRGSMMRLTFGGGYGNPLWTADGRYIVFRATRGMLWTRADGTGQPQPMTRSDYQQIPWSFSADGKRLAFVEGKSPGSGVLWTVLVESDRSGLRAGKAEMFLKEPFAARRRRPMFSPDGRWIAYESNESGANEVYVQAFPDRHGKQQISSAGGTYPAWSRTGHELFFWCGAQNRLMVTSYQERGDSFVADKPRTWSEKGPVHFGTTRSYDPAPDGRIVALMPADAPAARQDHMIFLLNFFDELRRRLAPI